MKGFAAIALMALTAFGSSSVHGADQPQLPTAPALSVYGMLPGVEDMSISPDGKNLAYVARVKDTRRIVLIDEGRQVRSGYDIGDAKIRNIRWASPTIAVVVMSQTQYPGSAFNPRKMEIFTAVILSLDGRKPQTVFGRDPAMARAIWGDFGTRMIGDKVFGYFAGTWSQASAPPALYQVDLTENTHRPIGRPLFENGSRNWLVGEAGEIAAVLDLTMGAGIWKISNRRGTTIASGKSAVGMIRLRALGKDGTTVIYSDNVAGVTQWFEVPLAGGTGQEILAGITLDRIFVDPSTGRMLGYLPVGAPARPVLFDPAQQARIDKIYRAFQKSDLRIFEWTPDFSKFLVHTSGNGDPGTWLVIDMASNRADPVGHDYPEMTLDTFGPISTVTYKASDGLDLDGVLTLPPGRLAKNLPVVILPHGGPHAHDRPSFDWWAQAFASRGYAVFQPNFRGSTGRGEMFMRADYGQWGRKMQTDLSDGLAELAKQGVVDPKRACIVGASYGGYAALAGVTLQKELYRCAVSVAGVSDLSDMYWTDYRESGGGSMMKRNLNESLGVPSTFAEVSPRKRAREANAPILLIHGKDDTVVPYKQSTAMLDALRDAGKPVEMVTLREEDHWLSRAATRLQMLEAAVGFVQKHNPAD